MLTDKTANPTCGVFTLQSSSGHIDDGLTIALDDLSVFFSILMIL